MFYVDDRFYASAPVLRIPRSLRAEAIGTWTLCGTWSSAFLKDGFVPDYMVDELGGTEAGAEALIEVGLWRRRRGGFLFNEWSKWQKTREQVEKYRQGERDRKSAARAAKPGNTGAVPPGQSSDSALSNPSSLTGTQETDKDPSGGKSRHAPASPDGQGSPHGDEPVDSMRPDLERIADRLRELVGNEVEIHPLHAATIADEFLSRKRGDPPRMATKYVLTCITNHANAVVNFIHTGRWSE